MSQAEQQLEIVTKLIHLNVPLHVLAPILRALADQWEQPAQVVGVAE